MVVRARQGRTQIGVLEDGVLVEHYVSRETSSSMAGNIYLGRVQNVLPSMEAAFVDIGRGRNAVLYAGEVNWDAAGLEVGSAKRIENALESGQSVLVQVTKDPIGHKGARLTSQISLPGRYLVYVPDSSMTGISRKLPDTERARLKRILRDVVPESAGVIVRTAAEGASEEELRADVERLTAIWDTIKAKADESLRHRRRSQPVEPSLGSMFVNPPGDFAGRLIEAAGLKGLRSGGLMVSALHANFFINAGGAGTARRPRMHGYTLHVGQRDGRVSKGRRSLCLPRAAGRRGARGIVGPGVARVATAHLGFAVGPRALPEAGEVARDLDRTVRGREQVERQRQPSVRDRGVLAEAEQLLHLRIERRPLALALGDERHGPSVDNLDRRVVRRGGLGAIERRLGYQFGLRHAAALLQDQRKQERQNRPPRHRHDHEGVRDRVHVGRHGAVTGAEPGAAPVVGRGLRRRHDLGARRPVHRPRHLHRTGAPARPARPPRPRRRDPVGRRAPARRR